MCGRLPARMPDPSWSPGTDLILTKKSYAGHIWNKKHHIWCQHFSQTCWLGMKGQKCRKQLWLSDSCFASSRLISAPLSFSSSVYHWSTSLQSNPTSFTLLFHFFPSLWRRLRKPGLGPTFKQSCVVGSNTPSSPLPSLCCLTERCHLVNVLLFEFTWTLGAGLLIYFPTEWNTSGRATCVWWQPTVCVGRSCGRCFSKLSTATPKFWYKPLPHVQLCFSSQFWSNAA